MLQCGQVQWDGLGVMVNSEWLMVNGMRVLGGNVQKITNVQWLVSFACYIQNTTTTTTTVTTTTTTTRQRICVYKNMHNTLYIDLQKLFYIGFLCVSTKPTKKSKFDFLTISRFQYFQYFSIWNKASRSNLNLYQKCTKFLVLLLFTIFVRMYTYTVFVCNLQVFRWRFKTILYTYVKEGLVNYLVCRTANAFQASQGATSAFCLT